jgi:hypothetical protein
MARNCLNKISAGFPTTCALPVHGIKELYLIYPEDVTIARASDNSWRKVTFTTSGKSYKIEGYKQNIQITSSLRSLDASNKFDVSVMFKVPYTRHADLASMLMNRFYVVAVPNDLNAHPAVCLGDTSPLEMTAADWDSNANGTLLTVTLSAPDGSAGNYLLPVESTALTAIISKAS